MTTYTGCCFGGPLDRQIVTNDSIWLRVAPPYKITDITAISGPLEPVAYRERTYTWRQFRHRETIYPCWVYDGGWIEDEKVERHVELAMQLMWELARAWWRI